MFNPLFFRRLVFVIGWMFFGAASVAHGLLCFGLYILSFACTVGEQYLAKVYGAAAEPLIPAWPSAAWRWVRARVHAGVSWTQAQLVELSKGGRVLGLGLAALAVFVLLPPLIRALGYKSFGGFSPDTLNAYTLGAAQYFLALTMAYTSWRVLFPTLYAYAAETVEGKLLESLISELLAKLPIEFVPGFEERAHLQLAAVAERRKIITFQFTQRCARFVFSCSPFFVFFWASNAALTAALTAVPAAGPAL